MLADLKMRGKILVRSPIQNSPSSRLYQGYLDFIFFFNVLNHGTTIGYIEFKLLTW